MAKEGGSKSMEGQSGRGAEEIIVPPRASRSESHSNSRYPGLWKWLDDLGLSPSVDREACTVFGQLAERCSDLNGIGRALFLLCFPTLEAEAEISSCLRQVVMGKCKGPHAMHRGQFNRTRPHFPFPLENGVALKELALASMLEEFVTPHFAGLEEDQVWVALSVMGLNCVAGFGRAI